MTTEKNTDRTVNCGSVAADEPLIKRYALGTKFYTNGISVPDMVERDDGDYVLHADFELLLRHNQYLEALLAKQAALASPEVQALRKDAERLSFIEDEGGADIVRLSSDEWEVSGIEEVYGTGHTLREAIDAAMEKQP